MNSVEKSMIRDVNLASQGRMKMDWAWEHMAILSRLREKWLVQKPFEGRRVAISLHLEAKTACLAELLHDAGAEVTITGSNPLSTQDDVCAALVQAGVTVFAKYNPSPEEYKQHLLLTLETRPELIIDDGGDLVSLLHSERQDLIEYVRGGCEETTTGINRLVSLEKSGELKFPMVAVNDAYSKCFFDNRYGTGQSVWDGINRTTNLVVAGKTVVVIGYGWCGKGVALRAKGLGAKVIVTEVDPIKAIEAHMDGYTVLPMIEAAKRGDIFVTVTGNKNVINGMHYRVMKNGAILANAGHFDIEIDKISLERQAVNQRVVRKDITEYVMEDGRKIYLLAEGRLVNLAAGDGHPAEIMDMTFALQALSLLYIHENHGKIGPSVIDVPYQLDSQVARYYLDSQGIQIDDMTEEQKQYQASWNL
ncbi:adenosylhomocysteinase [Thermoflavimicrobium daqui]|jgi:adenosylhomocysteinase|uniref:Adenosylhomocysteinase n=1 Tax=Thermoflavimicrobium daqui TaxID=2137476 RepID=A0A364K6S3_9BACL|nr:adenosylhomocysteinase [Thermoflavimicrobium daqui]RAL26006.1 adenosylhomocysteinase [Thermoflavimicrobium daqui]